MEWRLFESFAFACTLTNQPRSRVASCRVRRVARMKRVLEEDK